MDLSTPVSQLPMVGPAYAKRLAKLGITTLESLLHHYPHRYQDHRTDTIHGQIVSIQNVYTRSRRPIQRAVISTPSGSIQATWFNQPYLVKTLKPGTQVALAGKLASPEYEIIKGEPVHTGRLVPVYPETAGVSSKWLRSRIFPLLNASISDHLPSKIRDQNNLIDLSSAIKNIHFPQNQDQIDSSRTRLSFDEMFLLQLQTLKAKADWHQAKLAHPFHVDQDKVLEFITRLPFILTSSQNKAIKDILSDLGQSQPMNRLLQGDVGSGKTVVAATAIYIAHLNGFQSILMAPTEILANQHFNTLKSVFSPTGININLITASTKASDAHVFVGTHALLHRQLNTPDLGLVIIDEQHRFGVSQRATLLNQPTTPHLLTMTATPIPRTIALTLYADLDLSTLDELPSGRLPVKTWLVPMAKRAAAYNWIDAQVKQHHTQAFIICPLIEQSEVETMKDIRAVTTEFTQLKEIFPDLKLSLLHGKTKAKDKQAIMSDLNKGKIDILVATPVVEVGIDIPNATIILIEAAERFGLAQLHQLRGRVGRGHRQSYCLLFTTNDNQLENRRLKYLTTTHNGLKLAELDMKLRGPGHLYGTSQHGFLNLKLASLTDTKLLEATKSAAITILPHLSAHPLLNQKLSSALANPVAPN